MGVSLILFAVDRTHLSDVMAIHAWGLFGAQLWIQHHYKQETKELVTSLKL
jgi:GH35 family endo-1,4-beta-xylanase